MYPKRRSSRRRRRRDVDRAEFAIVSVALGVLSIIAWFIPVVGVFIALTGLGFGLAGRYSSKGTWAKAGLIINFLGLLAALIYIGLSIYWGR
ncbi:MAG: hypothetical protein D6796_07005 [Caldilineae bacterium]|nr:MAG: hypothetical protein D6796_07005 [Caldilineae bacterium]